MKWGVNSRAVQDYDVITDQENTMKLIMLNFIIIRSTDKEIRQLKLMRGQTRQ